MIVSKEPSNKNQIHVFILINTYQKYMELKKTSVVCVSLFQWWWF